MDPLLNPFAPGAGTPPPTLAGRDELIERTAITLKRVASGRPAKSFIVVGLRGVGKTVLLNEVYEAALEQNYLAAQIEAHQNKSLPALLLPKLRQLLIALDRIERAKDLGKRALRVLAGFTKSVSGTVGDIDISISIDPEHGFGDSGDLENDLADVFEAVGRAAKAKQTAIALIIDELQYLSENEMSALIMAMHRIQQRSLPLVLIGGGLPQILALAGRSKSYAERLFDYPKVGALEGGDARRAVEAPVRDQDADIEDRAIGRIIELTEGYPYFIQTWGHYAWNLSPGPSITLSDVEGATPEAIASLDESFFTVRFDQLTTAEKSYLFGMAELGPGPHKSGDIAGRLDRKVESVAPTRSGLIRKGMIYSPIHGETAFTVPMFDQFLKRAKAVPN